MTLFSSTETKLLGNKDLPGTIEALEDKVNNKSIRKMCEIYLKSIIKISERRKRRHSGVLIVNFGYLFHMFF